MLNQLLKKYDKYLGYKRNIDGTVTIYRRSPYMNIKYTAITVENQYIGSAKWLMRKLALMDSTRKDFIVNTIQNNQKLSKGREKDKRVAREIADFVANGGMTFVS